MNPNYLINIDNLIKNPTQDFNSNEMGEEPTKPKKPRKLKQKEIFYMRPKKSPTLSGAK
jgi:hypothetical protein